MKVTLPRAAATLALALVALALEVPRGRADSPSCSAVSELIASHPNFLQLEPGTYDNSCATLVLPDGYQLLGRGDSTMVVLAKQAGDLADVGRAATIANLRLQVKNAVNDVHDGVNPCAPGCWGVRLRARSRVERVRLQGTTLGFMLYGDHVTIRDSVSTKNLYGVFQDAGSTLGNADLEGNDLTGNATASIGISGWEQLDSAYMRNNHLGFSQYCWFAEGSASTHEFAVSNLDSASESCEQPHEAVAYNFGDRRTSGLWVQPHTPGGLTWRQGGPQPVFSFPGQTVIVGAGGDWTNGPLIGAAFRPGP